MATTQTPDAQLCQPSIVKLTIEVVGRSMPQYEPMGSQTDAIGPTVPRWALGHELEKARERAGLRINVVADALGCSTAKVRKMENGTVGTTRGDLKLLLDLYEIDSDTADRFEQLCAMGRERGWWSKYTRHITVDQATLFGVESAAQTIRTWEPYVIPGLLQTEEYARALISAWQMSPDEIERFVSIRMERQKLVLHPPPAMRIVLDEAALYRTFEQPDVLREQLARLLEPPADCLIQVLPLTSSHPGGNGSVTIFEFDPNLHAPIMYSETSVGAIYVEEEEVEASRDLLSMLVATALDLKHSQRMIRAAMEMLS